MAVTTKTKTEDLTKILIERTEGLIKTLRGRPLANNREGAKRGYWKDPDVLTYIDREKLSLSISDIKSVLSEISKIK